MRRESVNALKSLAYRACQMTSFEPERRGEQLLDDLESELQSFLNQLPEEVRAEYEPRYISKYSEWLSAMSRCFSVMITGGSKFDNRRHEKCNNAEHNARQRLDEWAKRIIKRCNRQERLKGWDEVERLQNKLEKLQEKQELMKATNKILRNQKMSEVEKYDELAALGWSQTNIQKLFEKDCFGILGFGTYMLSNNNAEIHRIEGLIKEKTANLSRTDVSTDYEFGTLELCYSEERIRFHFDGIPSSEVRDLLKSHAFKWSRYNSCWQRQITNNALWSLKHTIWGELRKIYNSLPETPKLTA